jgi:uncharacterized membrane protein
MSQYLKAIVAALGAVLTGLAVYYGHTTWYPIVSSGISALLVYLVPNTTSSPQWLPHSHIDPEKQ